MPTKWEDWTPEEIASISAWRKEDTDKVEEAWEAVTSKLNTYPWKTLWSAIEPLMETD